MLLRQSQADLTSKTHIILTTNFRFGLLIVVKNKVIIDIVTANSNFCSTMIQSLVSKGLLYGGEFW